MRCHRWRQHWQNWGMMSASSFRDTILFRNLRFEESTAFWRSIRHVNATVPSYIRGNCPIRRHACISWIANHCMGETAYTDIPACRSFPTTQRALHFSARRPLLCAGTLDGYLTSCMHMTGLLHWYRSVSPQLKRIRNSRRQHPFLLFTILDIRASTAVTTTRRWGLGGNISMVQDLNITAT